MKAFVCLSLLAVSSAAPAGPVLVGHHLGHHAVGATHASVSQVDNAKGLSEIQPAIAANKIVPGGKAAVAPLHSIAPVTHHAVHPVAHHAVHPVAHAVHAAPVVAHAVHAAPVVAHAVHAAPAYAPAPAYKAEEYPDEISPYTFTYAVADDYSKANFQRQEESDGA